MRKNKKIVLAIIMVSIIVLIGLSVNLILNNNIQVLTKTQIIKEMSESTQVSNLQTQINTLNTSHEEYAKNVQAYKTKIAEAITKQGVSTSADSTAEVMAENIGKILQSKTINQLTCLNFDSSSTSFYISNTYSHCYVIVSMAQVGGFAGKYYPPSVTNGTLIAQNSVSKSYDGITNGEAIYIFEISPVTAGSTITVSSTIGNYTLGMIYVFA